MAILSIRWKWQKIEKTAKSFGLAEGHREEIRTPSFFNDLFYKLYFWNFLSSAKNDYNGHLEKSRNQIFQNLEGKNNFLKNFREAKTFMHKSGQTLSNNATLITLNYGSNEILVFNLTWENLNSFLRHIIFLEKIEIYEIFF